MARTIRIYNDYTISLSMGESQLPANFTKEAMEKAQHDAVAKVAKSNASQGYEKVVSISIYIAGDRIFATVIST